MINLCLGQLHFLIKLPNEGQQWVKEGQTINPLLQILSHLES